MASPWDIYDFLIEQALIEKANASARIDAVQIGLTWTLCRSVTSDNNLILNEANSSYGLAMSPGGQTRTLPWPGSLAGSDVKNILPWLKSWNPYEATVAMATVNSVINANNPLLANAVPVNASGAGNLTLFDHFFPRLQNKNVVVIGHYPGLQAYSELLNLTILERNPTGNDYPDQACEYLLSEADWVFITASSLTNKTFPRLAELSKNAVTVLMGPTVPWVQEFVEYGIDFLAGVRVADAPLLERTVAEGGGTRIFENAVQYCVTDLSNKEIDWLKNGIADLVARREKLKAEMQNWYSDSSKGRFPKWRELERLDRDLSQMDTQFKRQWDARMHH